MSELSFTTAPAVARLNALRELLDKGTVTVEQAAEQTHITVRWARVYLNHLTTIGEAYICGYALRSDKSERRYPRAIFAAGPGKNVSRPKPLTRTQINARRRKREREDAEAWMRQIGKRRARTFVPRPDKAAAWLIAA
jgi:hypothetical protein